MGEDKLEFLLRLLPDLTFRRVPLLEGAAPLLEQRWQQGFQDCQALVKNHASSSPSVN